MKRVSSQGHESKCPYRVMYGISAQPILTFGRTKPNLGRRVHACQRSFSRPRRRDQCGPRHGYVHRPDQRALGRKVSDEFVVPLCRTHHRLAHRAGNERGWWKEAGIDPIKAARILWRKTRLNQDVQKRTTGLSGSTGSLATNVPGSTQ